MQKIKLVILSINVAILKLLFYFNISFNIKYTWRRKRNQEASLLVRNNKAALIVAQVPRIRLSNSRREPQSRLMVLRM
jgi:hypothetical protein